MAADFEVTLTGVEELKAALRGLPEKLRRRVLLGALRRAGQVISREAKIVAPILAVPTRTRTPGTVRKRISVRASKFARQPPVEVERQGLSQPPPRSGTYEVQVGCYRPRERFVLQP